MLRYGRNAVIALVLVLVYVYSLSLTEIEPLKLITGAPNAMPIIGDFLTPDILVRAEATENYVITYPVPCDAGPTAELPSAGPRIIPGELCSEPGDVITVEGFGLRPNTDVQLRWLLPEDRRLRSSRTETDANGYFSAEVEVRPIVTTSGDDVTRLEAELSWEVGELFPSEALMISLAKMTETIYMAFMATTLACLVAVPLSFLGAQNIVGAGPTYYVARSVFNLLRSIEALVIAVMFAIWLGFGPFAGVMAMAVVAFASLSKLFSEAIENIDPGPVEAITAAGGTRLQAIMFGVVPQIMPPFTAFAVYHWDINVRISTIIGFVGGGGIGLQLQSWINQLAYHQAGTAVWMIVIVVTVLDNISSYVRKQLV